MRVVLLEAPHSRQPSQRAARLVPVQHAEVGEPQRQLLVAAHPGVEHDEVARAVHRLQHPLLLLDVQAVHVVLVILVMPRHLEERRVVHVRGDHFQEAPQPVFISHELGELVVNSGAHGEPEARARREGRVEHEQLLGLSDVPVVPLRGLLLELLPLLHVLVAGEGDAVKPLQGVQILVSEPVRGGVLGDSESLGPARAGQVRPAAEVHEGAAAVATRHRAVGDLVGDELHLERVLAEQLQGLRFGQHAPLVGLLLLANVRRVAFDDLEVAIVQLLGAEITIVVEARLQGRADGEVAAELPLHGLPQDVGAGVPEHVLRVRVVELQEFHPATALQGPREVPEHAGRVGRLVVVRLVAVGGHTLLQRGDRLLVHQLCDDDGVRQTLGDALRDLHGRGLERLPIFHRAVWQLDLDGLPLLLRQPLLKLAIQPVPHL
mmetsp:Transcript_89688/g.274579  ORF Transcript_89688/g.274579 Transcript_89688/m.274579 type:complete len:434 (-) Transcript_89688:129-1430(-)